MLHWRPQQGPYQTITELTIFECCFRQSAFKLEPLLLKQPIGPANNQAVPPKQHRCAVLRLAACMKAGPPDPSHWPLAPNFTSHYSHMAGTVKTCTRKETKKVAARPCSVQTVRGSKPYMMTCSLANSHVTAFYQLHGAVVETVSACVLNTQ